MVRSSPSCCRNGNHDDAKLFTALSLAGIVSQPIMYVATSAKDGTNTFEAFEHTVSLALGGIKRAAPHVLHPSVSANAVLESSSTTGNKKDFRNVLRQSSARERPSKVWKPVENSIWKPAEHAAAPSVMTSTSSPHPHPTSEPDSEETPENEVVVNNAPSFAIARAPAQAMIESASPTRPSSDERKSPENTYTTFAERRTSRTAGAPQIELLQAEHERVSVKLTILGQPL